MKRIAQHIADHFQCPVLVRVKRNPAPSPYTQADHSLILRQGVKNLPIEERRKIARQIASTFSGGEERGQPSMTVEDIKKLPKSERVSLIKKMFISQEGEMSNPFPRQTTLSGMLRSKTASSHVNQNVKKNVEKSELPDTDTIRVELKKFRPAPLVQIGRPDDVVKLLKHIEDYDRESAKILHLDTKNQVVGVENISTGSLNASIVHPREAVKGAILNNSNAAIFVHNHPSGNPEPSSADIDVHDRLKNAFKTVGIDLLDSIVIGKDGYVSLKDRGL
ncbi:MAG: hypothetical protein M8353_03195 [ANME-2 cluster archaeon]|nr:hypothetical protein [ANME-2 cluster archaeon]